MGTRIAQPEMGIIFNEVKHAILMTLRKEVNTSVEFKIDDYNYRVFYSADPQTYKLSAHISAQGMDWCWLRQRGDKVIFEDIISSFDNRYEIIIYKIFEWMYNKFSTSNQTHNSLIDEMLKTFNLNIPTLNSDVRINLLEQKIRDLESLLIKEKPRIIGLKGTM